MKIKDFINNFINGWFYGFGFFLSNLYWISNSLRFDENFENLIIISIILIPSLLSIFYGLFSLSLKFFNVRMNFSSILIFSLSLSIFEYLRGTMLTGFPWNLTAFSLSDLIYSIQILSLIGTYSLNLLAITLFIFPTLIFFRVNIKIKIFLFLAIFIAVVTNNIYGFKRIEKVKSFSLFNDTSDYAPYGPPISLNVITHK